MKQGISPAVAVVVILIVVVIVAAVGYFGFMKPKAGTKMTDADKQKMMDSSMQSKQSSQPGGINPKAGGGMMTGPPGSK
jgi:Tfp pilus assembly protein PilO